MWTNQQILILKRAIPDFKIFVKEVFSLSVKNFIDGEHINDTCDFLQNNNFTMRVSARDHFKSMSIYAHFMWQLIRRSEPLEAHYFSYQIGMASYHIGKIKQLIAKNPFYAHLIDDKPTAEGIIKYHWDGEPDIFYTLEPQGMMGFKRGIHCPIIYVDDAFQDPASKLVLTVIQKINRIFKTEILDMPREQLHVVGTAQTNDDFYFDKSLRDKFAVKILPAIISEKEKRVLWPEWKSWENLQEIRKSKGDKIFNQEYLCSPTYAEEGFFHKDQVIAVVNPQLENLSAYKKHEIKDEVVGGFDIGKKAHPSHLSVFRVIKNLGKEKWIQIHQIFLDGWDYTRQLEYLKLAIDNFKIDSLNYDATRGEFESFGEEGRLPAQMKPVNFNVKEKSSMATEFSKKVELKEIELIDDRRQIEQILCVTNDLQAVETPDGHGDAFWSNCLAMKKQAEVKIRWL